MTDDQRSRHARAFMDEAVAGVYHRRPPFPAAVVDVLLSLLGDGGGAVLDAGCGTGDLGRLVVDSVERVDAVDMSQAMIDAGRRSAGGDHPGLRWICARMEEAPLDPPYAMVVAGDSLHWMDWDVVLPRLHAALRPGGRLAIVGREWGTGAPEERDLIRKHSTYRDYQPISLGAELVARGLFAPEDRLRCATTWRPTIEEYVESRHAQASFSRAMMDTAAAEAFDEELGALLRGLVASGRVRGRDDKLELQVVAEVGWGKPLPGRE
jgi:SAM-dependent methyltransferase